MSVGLREQLRDICEYIDGQQDPITRAEVQLLRRTGRPARLTTAPPVRVGWLVAVVSAVAVAVLLAAPLLLSRSGDTPPAISPPSPQPTSPPVTSAQTEPAQAEETEPRVSAPVTAPPDTAASQPAPGVVATFPPPEDVPVGVIETRIASIVAVSAEWTRVVGLDDLFQVDTRITELILDDSGRLVAVATDWTGNPQGSQPPPRQRATVFSSDDGITWDRVGLTPWVDIRDGSAGMSSAVLIDGTLLAMGSEAEQVRLWSSTDGMTWDIVGDGPGGRLAIGDAGRIVAATFRFREPEAEDPICACFADTVILYSDDAGQSWTQVPHDPEIFADMVPQTVVAFRDGFVVHGYDHSDPTNGDLLATILVSPDGASWSRIKLDPTAFSWGSGEPLPITVGGPGLVIAGDHCIERTGPCSDGVWLSADGLQWERINDVFTPDHSEYGGVFISDLVYQDGLFVAVGTETIRHEPQFDNPGPEPEERFLAVVWTSADGRTWTRITGDEPVFDNAAMHHIAALGGSFVIIGDRRDDEANSFPSATWLWTPQP